MARGCADEWYQRRRQAGDSGTLPARGSRLRRRKWIASAPSWLQRDATSSWLEAASTKGADSRDIEEAEVELSGLRKAEANAARKFATLNQSLGGRWAADPTDMDVEEESSRAANGRSQAAAEGAPCGSGW